MPKEINTNIKLIETLPSPATLLKELPGDEKLTEFVIQARETIANIVRGDDSRFLAIVGPCSIHEIDAARTYAERLQKLATTVSDRIVIVMRTYFEKPRTVLGWRGLLNDPDLTGECNVNKGLRVARQLLLDVNQLGLPCAMEWLDSSTPQYLADLISWGAIGARTTESQVHRQLASGVSMPIGFKNNIQGVISVAARAVIVSNSPHTFLGINKDGQAAVVHTTGNPTTHIILRGSVDGPNYDPASVANALDKLKEANLTPRLLIDCSHGNSQKSFMNQIAVFRSVVQQRADGNSGIFGAMLESNLKSGRQDITADIRDLIPGVSITDECVGWEDTEQLIMEAYQALS